MTSPESCGGTAEVGPETFELELVLAKDEEPSVDEWEQTRLSLADKLHGPPRLVFLMVYGETEYTKLTQGRQMSEPVKQLGQEASRNCIGGAA